MIPPKSGKRPAFGNTDRMLPCRREPMQKKKPITTQTALLITSRCFCVSISLAHAKHHRRELIDLVTLSPVSLASYGIGDEPLGHESILVISNFNITYSCFFPKVDNSCIGDEKPLAKRGQQIDLIFQRY